MSSSARASWPSSSSLSAGKTAEKSPAATRSAPCSSAFTRRAIVRETTKPPPSASSSAERAGDQDLAADQRDVALHVDQRRGEDDDAADDALVADRLGDLRERDVAAVLRAARLAPACAR